MLVLVLLLVLVLVPSGASAGANAEMRLAPQQRRHWPGDGGWCCCNCLMFQTPLCTYPLGCPTDGMRTQPQFALSAFVSIAVACPKREARGTPKICPVNDKARLQ